MVRQLAAALVIAWLGLIALRAAGQQPVASADVPPAPTDRASFWSRDDIEARWRMPGGHWHHGELQVDKMLMNRPFFGVEQYAAPVDGLWLASAGSHPGGGISGVPGLNAARAVLGSRA